MIARIWHGWTTSGDADTCEALLREEIFTGIQNRHIPGLMSGRSAMNSGKIEGVNGETGGKAVSGRETQ